MKRVKNLLLEKNTDELRVLARKYALKGIHIKKKELVSKLLDEIPQDTLFKELGIIRKEQKNILRGWHTSPLIVIEVI
ncbi:MAG: hypothetical protein AAF632_29185 [Bacteroidota bacterium]